MSDIPTWRERAMRHPDHQTGMVSEDMIRARMAEEIADLRAEVERLRAEVARMREIIRTIRARCVELDDVDAVSATLDITSAVLDSKP